MNIKCTPEASLQIEIVTGTPANETGFLVGQEIGKIRVIESLFPLNFDPSNVDKLYADMYAKLGGRLMGVFFNTGQPFENEWFIEDIVIKIEHPRPRFYLYDIDNRYMLLEGVEI